MIPANRTRRQVLRGAAGFALAIPFLPSLAPHGALAATPVRRRFVAVGTKHGGLTPEGMYPAASSAPNAVTLFGDHQIHWGPLRRTVAGANASVSRVIGAAASALTDRMVSRMNVLRGLDIPFDIDHHTGGFLGNFAAHSTAGDSSASRHQPTIDQVMAWSPSFYPSLGGIRERSLVIGTTEKGSMSFSYSSPQNRTGDIIALNGELDARRLFGRLFTPGEAPPVPGRPPVVDRVLASFKGLRDGNRRLSAADRQRLSDHMERLAELQRRVVALPGVSCGTRAAPAANTAALWAAGDVPSERQFYSVMNDLVAAAFLCDATRVVTMHTDRWFSTFKGDWHKDVAHQHDDSGQPLLVESQQRSFEAIVLDLANKLDVDDGSGTSMLDGSLILWTQEHGKRAHRAQSLPVVTLGSAGGFFKTGNYVNYQHPSFKTAYDFTGILYAQLLGNILLAMGIPAKEWKLPGNWGYGLDVTGWASKYRPEVFPFADQKLPVVTA